MLLQLQSYPPDHVMIDQLQSHAEHVGLSLQSLHPRLKCEVWYGRVWWDCRQEVSAGEAAAARGRAGVEAKLGALTDRLLHMARKEAKREKRQGALSFLDCSHVLFSLTNLVTKLLACCAHAVRPMGRS